ncbi:penicillin-binding protein 1B [Lysobacter fragariae]
MAIDYDEDEQDEQEEGQPEGEWKRRLVTWTLAAIGLGLGFLIPYMLYLNHQVSERFGRLQWQVPTRVYARPLELRTGLAMDSRTLKTELDAASYHEGDGSREGSYAQSGGRWKISSRGFNDVDGKVPARRVEVVLSGGRVASVRDVASKGTLKSARLDPARIASLYGQKQEERRLVRIEEVPELLVTGLQAVEDRDFNHHIGIDFTGMLRAAFKNATGGRRQGASTLTQQLARSGLLGIGKERTFSRKFNEILYALIIDARYEKRDILEAYLNQVYLGQRGAQAIHGVAAGAEFWFGRDLRDLSTEQIALLIGEVKGPSAYDPRRHPAAALDRRNFVLGEMLETKLIDKKEYERAKQAPLGVTDVAGNLAPNRFPAYVDLVRRQLARDYPADALVGAGLSVMSGMSPSAQAQAEGAALRTLKSLDSKRRPPLQTGLVVTDVHNGEVVAVVGSRVYSEHGFNRAVEAQRPVGSLLKPFVYLLALATPERYSLASYVDDSPVTVQLDHGKRWSPGNSDGRSHGSVRLVDALAHSYNQATVRVGMQVAPERVADLIKTLAGIQAEPRPSLILGAVDQSPYAMAQLYQFLASGGEIQPLHAVRGVLDASGRAVKRYDSDPPPAQEGDAIAARLITIAGQQTVTSGTASQLVRDGLGRLNPAGKTGTSNDGRDSWFAGWTGDHLAVIWVGNDQNQETGLYGATGAMRVWSAIFSRLPTAPLDVGDKGIDWQWVVNSNTTDAACAGARQFPFVAGFAPDYTPCPMAAPEPEDDEGGSWRDWFGLGRDKVPSDDEKEPAEQVPPPPQ